MRTGTRDFLMGLTAVTAACSGSGLWAADAAQRLNVLFIPVDDLKPLLGCYGARPMITPNIDRLAKRGVVFANAQCQQAVCGPSRACVMTGLYPDATGVYDLKTRMRDINPKILALPEYFRQQGYTTTGVGKTYDPRCVDDQLDAPSWSLPHVGKIEDFRFNPRHPKPKWGYQDPQVHANSDEAQKLRQERLAAGQANAERWPWPEVAGSHPATEALDLPDDAYDEGALANTAIDRLNELNAAGKPFFLSVGFHKPHLPFIAPKRYWDLYDRDAIAVQPFQTLPLNGPKIAHQPGWELRSGYSDVPKGELPIEYQKELIHGYYACVSYVDAQLGRVLDRLDELGLGDKTVICLWGDHGWHLGDHGMWCKHSNFEQAVRAPLIIATPGIKGAGQTASSPVGFVDIFPTLCEAAGLPVPDGLQGKSLVPMLNNAEGSVREMQLSQYPRNHEGAAYMGYSLRSKRHRYTAWVKHDDLMARVLPVAPVWVELYDYETDPEERVNHAGDVDLRERVAAFEAELNRQLAEIWAHPASATAQRALLK